MRSKLIEVVKQALHNREADLKWAIAYGDYDEPFKEIAEDIVDTVLKWQDETPIS